MLSEQQSQVSSSIPELNGPSVQERFRYELLPPEIKIGRLLTSSGIQLMDITRGRNPDPQYEYAIGGEIGTRLVETPHGIDLDRSSPLDVALYARRTISPITHTDGPYPVVGYIHTHPVIQDIYTELEGAKPHKEDTLLGKALRRFAKSHTNKYRAYYEALSKAAPPSFTDLGLSLDLREGNIILNIVVTKGRFYLFLKTAQTTDMEAAVTQLRMSTAQESSRLQREVNRLKKTATTPEDIDKVVLPSIAELCRNNSVGFYMGALPSDASEGMVLQRVA